MKKRTLAAELWRDRHGASMVEFTIIMPMLIVLTLGTVDLGYLLYDYAVASKAAYVGAHRAVVSSPAASDITTVTWTATDIGKDCSISTGSSGFCASYVASTTCTKPTTPGSCTNGHTFDDAAFTAIVGTMQQVFGCTAGSATCALQPKNVSITYNRSGTLGFVGQPNGLPMNVTVAISCMEHRFYFIGGLMGFVYTPPAGCTGSGSGWGIPNYSTTLTSEDLSG